MPGKWSGLKDTVEKMPVESEFQNKVNAEKTAYLQNSTAEKARVFCFLRDQKDKLESEIRELNVKLEALSQLMIEELEANGTDLFRLDSGDTLSIKDEPYVSVQDRSMFLSWIKATDQEDLLTVNYMTLSSMTKKRLVEGLSEPPGLKVFIKQSITRRKGRG